MKNNFERRLENVGSKRDAGKRRRQKVVLSIGKFSKLTRVRQMERDCLFVRSNEFSFRSIYVSVNFYGQTERAKERPVGGSIDQKPKGSIFFFPFFFSLHFFLFSVRLSTQRSGIDPSAVAITRFPLKDKAFHDARGAAKRTISIFNSSNDHRYCFSTVGPITSRLCCRT